ncbi:APC family permease [Aureimonas phyllosphaerae]|uniref:Amino acid transporter n=1 Tax=Aureimonas phyllosphaerae TaxID=1166078 RepID=A0A7W6BY88_9HYPH|nr:amino acid permease [Aureimonas phyllosphaerae]MBB3935876.1 amino acid transporter [Aureimonas phyllosphaerae]MBB3959884.1 amino acid transporter [Aureimonas phyllosphaerae]SFF16139.1 amino acid/polyamine/organocation transporter, APC superfamily [Aureimonas phyllosphaerae]
MAKERADEPGLKRSVGLFQVTLLGLGSMLGAGVYGLIGEAASELGSAVWVAFMVSMVAALLTGLSYASIASRYPRAGGAAYVTQRAYRYPLLSYTVGLAVVCSGLTSIATQSNVVARNFASVTGIDAPQSVLAIGFLVILAGILFRGITESLWLNAVCTIVEAFGLILVIAVGISWWGSADLLEFPPPGEGAVEGSVMLLVAQGAVLTFFSFIGFEDMLNVSEEVKNPERTMPIAMISAMLMATVIYICIAITAVSVVPWRELAEAAGPLTLVVERAAPWFPTGIYAGITIFAVANTALVNYVMASRLLYGMSRQGLMPAALGRVHTTRRTPYVAIAALLAIVVLLSLVGDIGALAASTVLLLLIVFTVVNVALLVLQRRPGEAKGQFEVPSIVPLLGAIICSVLIVVRIGQGEWTAPIIAIGLIVAIVALFYLTGVGRSGGIDRFIESEAGS